MSDLNELEKDRNRKIVEELERTALVAVAVERGKLVELLEFIEEDKENGTDNAEFMVHERFRENISVLRVQKEDYKKRSEGYRIERVFKVLMQAVTGHLSAQEFRGALLKAVELR